MPVTDGAGFDVLRGRDRVPVVPVPAHVRGQSRKQGWTAVALVMAVTLCAPRWVCAMAADGSLITNTVSATFYSMAGVSAAMAYRTTYLATANVTISCPMVIMKKVTTNLPTTFTWGQSYPVPFQAAGGLVTFRIWVVNPSLLASAFNVCITDRLSDNTEYALPAPFALAPWTWAPGGQWYATGSATNAAPWNPIVAGTTGQDVPFYLRWCLFQLGPGKSAYVEYAVNVL